MVRHRGQVLSHFVQVTLAAGFPLSVLCRTDSVAFQARRGDLLPVLRLPPSNHLDGRHDVRRNQAAAAHLDAGLAPVDGNQDQSGGAGVDAPSGRQLQDRLADEAQDHAGHGRARGHAHTQRVRADRRCLHGRGAQRRQSRTRIGEQTAVPGCRADRCDLRCAELCGDRAGAQFRQRLAAGLDRASPGAGVRGLHRWTGLLPSAGRRRARAYDTGHRRRAGGD